MGLLLRAPDRVELWARLALTEAQVAELCGLTVRQVRFWARQGYVAPAPGRARRYDGAAVERCLLLKQARRAGVPLGRAAALAQTYDAAQVAVDPPGMAEVAAALRQAETGVGAVLAVLDLAAR